MAHPKMAHPSLLDKLRSRYNPRYLYPGQACHTLASVTVGILHQTPVGKTLIWKPVDYREIKKGSVLRFFNYAGQAPVDKEISKYESVMEILSAESDFPVNPGDMVLVNHNDRQFMAPLPPEYLPSDNEVPILTPTGELFKKRT